MGSSSTFILINRFLLLAARTHTAPLQTAAALGYLEGAQPEIVRERALLRRVG
jgi:hypothetical protein